MKDTEQLEKALTLLREADADRGASPFVETRLRAAFREHHGRRRRAFSFRWAAAAGMIACAGLVVWRLATPAAVEAPKTTAIAVARPPAVKSTEVPVVKQERPVVARRRTPAPVTVAKAPARRPV